MLTVTLLTQGPVFASALGKAVYSILFETPSTQAFMAFQPGRMAFQYDLDDPAAPDVPTTNRRSEADCPKVHRPPVHTDWHS